MPRGWTVTPPRPEHFLPAPPRNFFPLPRPEVKKGCPVHPWWKWYNYHESHLFLHNDFTLFILCIFFKFKFHQFKSYYQEDCLQSISELWHISKLTFGVILVKIIPEKGQNLTFAVISVKIIPEKVNLRPGAGWSIRKSKCLNIRKTHVFSIQIPWHKKSWDKRKSNFVTEEILLRIHLVALSKWNFTLAVLALKLDHWDVGFNSFYFLFLLKISHLFSIEVLARWVIVLMFLLLVLVVGKQMFVGCWSESEQRLRLQSE